MQLTLDLTTEGVVYNPETGMGTIQQNMLVGCSSFAFNDDFTKIEFFRGHEFWQYPCEPVDETTFVIDLTN